MLSPSSIFSFDTVRVTPRISGAVLLATAVVLAVRGALAVVTHDGRAWPLSLPAQTDAMREYQCRTYASDPPSVLLMGTSRLVDVSAACVAQRLSLPRDRVMNLSHLGNSFWRNLALLRRNPAIASSARAVYVDVSPFQLTNEDLCSDEQFLRYATLEERALVSDPKQRAVALADWALPMQAERRTVPQWVDAVSYWTMPERLRRDVVSRRVDAVKRLLWLQIGANKPEVMANNLASTGPVTPLNRSALEGFVDQFPPGCHIIFLHVPTYGDMHELMFKTPERQAAWKALRAELERLKSEDTAHPISILWPTDAEALGLDAKDFLGDDTHFNDAGNAKLCGIIAEHIRERAGTLD